MKHLDYINLYFDDPAAGGDPAGNDGGNNGAGNNGTGNPAAGNNNNNNGAGNQDDRNTPKYSDSDLDKIISRKLAKWSRQQAAAVDEATRLANMTAQERAEHERDALQKELDELKRANAVADMERTARGILQADGVTIPDEIVANLVGEDADATSTNVKAFSKAFKAAVQEEVKRQLSHKTPAAGTKTGALTKADIWKEKDPIKRQKLIRENLTLFGR